MNRIEHAEPINRSDILTEAYSVIYGDREQTYGSPDKNLQNIADMWSVYLNDTGRKLGTNDVCIMMMLLKMARLMNDPNHRDSQVDICGYAALMERVQIFRKGFKDPQPVPQPIEPNIQTR